MPNTYENPLVSRYAGPAMLELFSPDVKFRTWRRLWIALARAEKQLGLSISDRQIDEMEANIENIDYERTEEWEKKLRHDVMAHIHAWGEQCPAAMPIIHLGATSCYVGDNTDIIIMRQAMELIRGQLLNIIEKLAEFAREQKSQPTLGFTHFQPAQPVTVGKRAALWLNDLLTDLDEIEYRISRLRFLGSKGTTGTQASFLELFDGDHQKVDKLEMLIASEMGFNEVVPVSGQTYSRKTDASIAATLSGIAQSASKFAMDVRLLSHLKELEEPFEGGQVGSSAMPYKRNPMRSERICSLARVVTACAQVPAETAATQWFERTLDDSAGKRLAIPEAFLAVDAILSLQYNIISGCKIYPMVISRRLNEELPFMATENILMKAVRNGGDRQELHERIRQHSVAAGHAVKEEGKPNDLLERIAGDEIFGLSMEDLTPLLDPMLYIGRCPEQVDAFLTGTVYPVLERNKSRKNRMENIRV